MTLIVTCLNCSATGTTEDHGRPDAAVQCQTEAGNPPGSVDGCCSSAGHGHDEHLAHVEATGDASNRPVRVTIAGAGLQGAL